MQVPAETVLRTYIEQADIVVPVRALHQALEVLRTRNGYNPASHYPDTRQLTFVKIFL